MPHDHSHLPSGSGGERDWRLVAAIAVNFLLTVAQVVGGLLSGSLALIADALHNLSDALSLVIAFAARRIARRPADDRMTFGYARAETVAALINYTTLIVIGLYLAYEAVGRFFAPEEIEGWTVVIIAGIALAVDLVTAGLTWAMSKDSQNIRAAFLHNLADAAGSVGVILAGVLILLFGWTVVDPIVTLMIAGYVLWMSLSEIGGVIRILMLGRPPELETETVIRAMEEVEGVSDVHHVHLWQIEEHLSALQAHVAVEDRKWAEADRIKQRLKVLLADRFGIAHATLELECSRHTCDGTRRIGHG